MKLNITTKQEAENAIIELQKYIKGKDIEWVSIDYSVIPKETFDKYGAKPFQIMKRKMRDENGRVWNNIDYFNAIKEAEKLGYRLQTIQEHLVLLDAYKEKHQDDASIHHKEFLGIEELSYGEDVCYEWVYANQYIGFLRGGSWGNGGDAGVETLVLNNAPGYTSSHIGFRCTK